MKMRNYIDERIEKDIESFFKNLTIALFVFLALTVSIAFFYMRGCESELKPVTFEEQYTPTKFNKL